MMAPVNPPISRNVEFELFKTTSVGVIEQPIYPHFGLVQFQNRSWPASFYDSPSAYMTTVGDRVTVVGRKRGILLIRPLDKHGSMGLDGDWDDGLLAVMVGVIR